jgi:hypothetical protein
MPCISHGRAPEVHPWLSAPFLRLHPLLTSLKHARSAIFPVSSRFIPQLPFHGRLSLLGLALDFFLARLAEAPSHGTCSSPCSRLRLSAARRSSPSPAESPADSIHGALPAPARSSLAARLRRRAGRPSSTRRRKPRRPCSTSPALCPKLPRRSPLLAPVPAPAVELPRAQSPAAMAPSRSCSHVRPCFLVLCSQCCFLWAAPCSCAASSRSVLAQPRLLPLSRASAHSRYLLPARDHAREFSLGAPLWNPHRCPLLS